MTDWLPLICPSVAYDDLAGDFRAIADSGRLTQGPYLRRFEESVGAFAGVRFACATTSATTALHLALAACGIGAGDEVLVSDFTFPATGNAIAQAGATPVLVDSCPDGFVMDVDDAATKITERTKAIMVVDPFGQPADLGRVLDLARAHDLRVIEDAACALGSYRDGRPCGGWPDIGVYSFHPRKIITTGEGGMLTTDDEVIARRVEILRNHGSVAKDGGRRFEEFGFNYRMNEFQAAMGLRQMARLEAIVADRRRTARRYIDLLAPLDGVAVPLSAPLTDCNFQSFVVVLDGQVDRAAVIEHLKARSIESTLGTYAMHAHPAYGRLGYRPGQLARSFFLQDNTLTLPLLPAMDEFQMQRVVDGLKEALA
ncbi:MAG: DegT/DnrJ/EryC1/StrS family aminotransferase [Rhodospirillales bacterium]|jgi:dTDP-4-amino-4,6-dideoxygalactose transaminase|nr:DegT/DnrJ/EryC1/StrS family aminotransferase [Rhodospirillales bacterium]